MSAAFAVFPSCGLCFAKFSTFTEAKFGISIFHKNEIADGTSLCASRNILLQPTSWNIRSGGNGRGLPRRNSVSSITAKEGKNWRSPQSSDGESSYSSDQEEIIALFRRIQSSISKGGSVKKRNSDNHKEKQSTESVLDVLRQSRKQAEEEDKVLPRRRRALKKEERAEDSSSRPDFKLTRPPSNFVKRSPIPTPLIPKGNVVEVTKEGSPVEELELQRIDEMKLPELKELAKSRGIKGYSKLKKGDLIALLKGLKRS